ncbi:PD-(D/E)XK nuclease family protein, partial [Ruegeria sp. NA]
DAGLDEDAAKLRGTRVHLLLEHLPKVTQNHWPELCARLLPDMRQEDQSALLTEVTGVLTSESLRHIFTPDTLAEIPVTADLNGQRMYGIVDRLIVTDTEVHVIDFKSNAIVPNRVEDCPEGLLRQMGAYAQALSQIYPNHKIRTAILWTRTANLMWLPHDLVTDAVACTQIS